MSSSPVSFNAADSGGGSSDGARPNLQHAYLNVYEPSTTGTLTPPSSPKGKIEFQFNPKELSLSKSASWKREDAKGAKKAAPPQFTGSQPSKLTIEMFFDASAKPDGSVVKIVEQLFALTVPTADSLAAKKASPPWVIFRWGGLTGFLAYVSQVQAKYTLFTASGVPIRATCTVTLDELSGDTPRQNPTSGGVLPHRVHEVVIGDTLPAIAFREYGVPALWRAVATVNGIDDPMRIRPGHRLLLPSLEEISPTGTDAPRGLLGSGRQVLDAAR
ncbi:peptidase M23 [Nocardioides albidus]|uniref:Peptidase M23 n=1 Tax=Nocardioides albidus TaxID=1517589 RepID=A0A5C4VUX1_9ACTN|nr:LysM peptidoglycan-binding domain-containing protein [Nocardioides albidus]TNM39704.1 peptidase M23 [Nocardioides albidus]